MDLAHLLDAIEAAGGRARVAKVLKRARLDRLDGNDEYLLAVGVLLDAPARVDHRLASQLLADVDQGGEAIGRVAEDGLLVQLAVEPLRQLRDAQGRKQDA